MFNPNIPSGTPPQSYPNYSNISNMIPSNPVPENITQNLSPIIKDTAPEFTGPYMFIILDQATIQKIKDNLFKVLQKLGTSNKTKLLHPIIDKNKFKFTAGMVGIEDNTNHMSTASIQGNKLNGFYINIYEVLEPEDRTLIVTILDIINEINQNKSKITDNNDFVLAKLVKNRNDLSVELVNRINYFKLVDIMFYEYLNTLVRVVKQKQNIFKIMEKSSEVLGMVLTNLIQKMGGTNPEINSITQKTMLLYLIQHFSTSSDTEVKVFLFKSGLINEDEYKNYLKLKTFEDLSKYLTINNVLNISPNSLRNNFKNVIGEAGLELLEGVSSERLISYMILNKQANNLFTTYLTSTSYKAYLDSLELLVLNAKSYIVL